MACKNQKCEKCSCDKPIQPEIPATLPMAIAVPAPVEPPPETPDDSGGFWQYVIFFTVGWLFVGC